MVYLDVLMPEVSGPYYRHVRIGLLSDTHGFLDEAVFSYFAECDEIWHAGDFGSAEVVKSLRAFKPLRGVSGNVDGADVRAEVDVEVDWECEGMRVYMRHIGGRPGAYDARAKKALADRKPDLFVCGHSHILLVARDPALGLLHFNPGAAGHNGWHKMRTMLRFSIVEGKVSGVEAIELGPRGRGGAKPPMMKT